MERICRWRSVMPPPLEIHEESGGNASKLSGRQAFRVAGAAAATAEFSKPRNTHRHHQHRRIVGGERMLLRIVRVALGLVGCLSLAFADTLVLKSGSTVQGSFLSGSNRSIRFATGDRVNTYSIADIDSIKFGGPQADKDAPSSSNSQ